MLAMGNVSLIVPASVAAMLEPSIVVVVTWAEEPKAKAPTGNSIALTGDVRRPRIGPHWLRTGDEVSPPDRRDDRTRDVRGSPCGSAIVRPA
jgi:hypothetical protein